MIRRHCDREGCNASEVIDEGNRQATSHFIVISISGFNWLGSYCSWQCVATVARERSTREEARLKWVREHIEAACNSKRGPSDLAYP